MDLESERKVASNSNGVSPNNSPRRRSNSPTSPIPLVVDELDINCHISKESSRNSHTLVQATPHVVGVDKIKELQNSKSVGAITLGPVDMAARAPCPCCARYVVKSSNSVDQQHDATALTNSPSADDDRNDNILAGSLGSNVDYTVTSILVQGWVHKKGTGKDIFGSRAWKSRWATLATASVPGYDVDVPVLLIYWFPSSDTPSTVLVLDPEKTVVMPVDRYPTEEKVVQWNTFTFEIVHRDDNTCGDEKVTRVFSVPEKERSDWVLAINKALRDYETRERKYTQEEEKKAKREGGKNNNSMGRDSSLLRPPLSPTARKAVLL